MWTALRAPRAECPEEAGVESPEEPEPLVETPRAAVRRNGNAVRRGASDTKKGIPLHNGVSEAD